MNTREHPSNLVTSNQHTRSVTLLAGTCISPSGNLRRRTRKARRHIKDRAPVKEVTRAKKERHRLSRHDRVVFRRGEVRETESVPQHDVCVINGTARTSGFDPGGQTFRGFAGGLGHVAASWVDLVVVIWGTKLGMEHDME